MYPIVIVDSRQAVTLEPLGTKRKFWFRGADGEQTLFKAEQRGTGEDWAEKIVCELAELLGLPHVHYELAHDSVADVPGVVCKTCTPDPRELVMGNQLMQAIDPAYPHGRRYKVREHTVETVLSVVSSLKPPIAPYATGWPAGIETAVDVFVGYVMLDAWVANQDRHHENWAAVDDGGERSLAPTFDHGASLARNLMDSERSDRLQSRDSNRRIPAFVRQARSAFYADPQQTKTMKTFDAWQAFSQNSPASASTWIARLGEIGDNSVLEIIDKVPPQRMSQISRAFTLALLTENRSRLLTGEG